MTDYRTDPNAPGVRYTDGGLNTVPEERSGSGIFLVLGIVVALAAVVWFAFSGTTEVNTLAPPAAIESSEPAAPPAGGTMSNDTMIAPDAATPETAPAPEVVPELEPAPAPVTPAPSQQP